MFKKENIVAPAVGGNSPTQDGYRHSGEKNVIWFNALAQKWFIIVHDAEPGASHEWNANTKGFCIYSQDRSEQDESNWEKVSIVGPDAALNMQPKGCIGYTNPDYVGFGPADIDNGTFSSQNMTLINEFRTIADNTTNYNMDNAYFSHFQGGYYDAWGTHMEVAWDEASQTLHCIQVHRGTIVYSKWSYASSINTFTQLNATEKRGNCPRLNEELLSGGYEFRPRASSTMPWHQIIFMPYQNTTGVSYQEEYRFYWDRVESEWGYHDSEYHIAATLDYTRSYYAKLVLVDGKPRIYMNLCQAESPNNASPQTIQGSTWFIEDGDNNWNFNLPTITSMVYALDWYGNSGGNNYMTLRPQTLTELVDDTGNYNTGKFIVSQHPVITSMDRTLNTKIIDLNGINEPWDLDQDYGYENQEHEGSPIVNSTGSSVIKHEFSSVQYVTCLSPEYKFKYIVMLASMAYSATPSDFPSTIINVGKITDDSEINWVFNSENYQEIYDAGATIGEEDYNPTEWFTNTSISQNRFPCIVGLNVGWQDGQNNPAGIPSATKTLIANPNAGNITILQKYRNGSIYSQKLELATLEENDFTYNGISWHHITDTSGGALSQFDLLSPLINPNIEGIGSFRSIQVPKYAPISTPSVPLISHALNNTDLIGGFVPVDYAPPIGAIYDLSLHEQKITSAVVQFTVTTDDDFDITHFKFIRKLGPIFASDFYENNFDENLVTIAKGDLESESFVTEDGVDTIRYEYEYKDIEPGLTWYLATSPVIPSLDATRVSNVITVYLPPNYASIPSKHITVPMNDSAGALYIGTGNDIENRPKWVGKIKHKQFGTQYNQMSIEDAAVESPAGADSVSSYDRMISTALTTSEGIAWYMLAYNIGDNRLQFIHKDTGVVKRTGLLPCTISAACQSGNTSTFYIFDGPGNSIHSITIDLSEGGIESSAINKTWAVQYIPEWLKYADTKNQNYYDWLQMTGQLLALDNPTFEEVDYDTDDITDFANSKREDLSVADMKVESGKIYLLADTEGELVPPGFTCLLRAKFEADDTLTYLPFEDAMFPWNPTVNCTDNAELEGNEYESGPDGTKDLYTKYSAGFFLGHVANSTLTNQVKGKKWVGDTGNPDTSFQFIMNTDVGDYNGTTGQFSGETPAEVHLFANWHGPHQMTGSYDSVNGDFQGHPYGLIPIPGTMNLSEAGGIGYYAKFVNVRYRNLYSHFLKSSTIQTQLPNPLAAEALDEYHSYETTDLDGIYWVEIDVSEPNGWHSYVEEGEITTGNGSKYGVHAYAGVCTGNPNHAIAYTNNIECLGTTPGVRLIRSDLNNIDNIDIKDITSSSYAEDVTNSVNTGNSVVAVRTISNDLDGTTFLMEDLNTKQEARSLSNFQRDANHLSAIHKGQIVTGITSGTNAAYGKIELTFPSSDSSNAALAANANWLKIKIRGLPTTVERGDSNNQIGHDPTEAIGGFDILFWRPAANSGNFQAADAINTASISAGNLILHPLNPDADQRPYGEKTWYEAGKGIEFIGSSWSNVPMLCINKWFQTSSSQDNPTGAEIVSAIEEAFKDAASSTSTYGEVNPFIICEKDGSTAHKLVITTLQPIDADNPPVVSFEHNGCDTIVATLDSGTTITSYSGNANFRRSDTLFDSSHKNALVVHSSSPALTQYGNDSFPYNGVNYDGQLRALGRDGTVILSTLYQDYDPQSGNWTQTPWTGNFNGAYQEYSLVMGASITSTPGAVKITGDALGDYSKGTCRGCLDSLLNPEGTSGVESSDFNDDEDECLEREGTFTRTGSSKFDPGKTYYYRASYTYDGFQESPLTVTTWQFDMNEQSAAAQKDGFDTLKLVIYLKDVPKRATHITLWRRDDDDEALFRQVEQVSLGGGWTYNGEAWYKIITDPGREGASYEATTGISSLIASSSLHYNISTVANNMLFVTQAYIRETEETYLNLIFRSQPGNYSMFNWGNDYLKMDAIPTALASMGKHLYAWDKGNMHIIDPLQMYIIESFKGIGCLGKESVIVAEPGMFWFDDTNVYLLPRSGGIGYIGSKILTSEHDIGWQENTPDIPYKAIYDPIKKSFGMCQQYAPAKYFMFPGTDTMTPYGSADSGVFSEASSYLNNIGIFDTTIPTSEDIQEDEIGKIASNHNMYRHLKALQKMLLSKKITKADKRKELTNFISKHKTYVNAIKRYVSNIKNEQAVILGMICMDKFVYDKGNLLENVRTLKTSVVRKDDGR